mgnify:CR=1 FL=1
MAYNRRKRKVKKNIPEGQAHIHSTYNNTVVSITDVEGNPIIVNHGKTVINIVDNGVFSSLSFN